MNGTHDIYAILRRAVLLLLVCGSLAACVKDEEFDDAVPADRNTLLASGRYLTARNSSPKIGEGDAARWFEVGTRYRLLAYVKAYMGDVDGTADPALIDDKTPAEQLRFDLEAWEDEVSSGGLRFIHVTSDAPDLLFGFPAIPSFREEGGPDGLMSLDFYGFTYGEKAEASDENDYIKLSGSMGRTKLKRHEEVDAEGELKDLMWGMLLNQNIITAGNRKYVENAADLPPAEAAQSVLPFIHCFARLDVQIVQEGEEKTVTGADGKPVTVTEPIYPNLYVDGIRITNTYSQGDVYMHNGLVEVLGSRGPRALTFRDAYGEKVDAVEVMPVATEVGKMMIFPSDGNSLTNADEEIADGYYIGMEIDVRCDNKTTLTQYLVNTKTAANAADAEKLIASEKDAEGREWYKATIVKSSIVDSYDTGTVTGSGTTFRSLLFERNTIYQLQVTFSEHTVRIITVIPQVMDWMPGEGSDGWQEQAIGQPQMFDNIVWSDRNLGADHFDPKGENFEKTIGYFYQTGRNIPYYPFDTRLYYKPDDPEWCDEERRIYWTLSDADKKKKEEEWKQLKMEEPPTLADKHTTILANVQDYNNTTYRFYPMVDPILLYKDKEYRGMNQQLDGFGTAGGNGSDWTWTIGDGEKYTMIDIPETTPKFYNHKDSLGERALFDYKKSNLRPWDNMEWDKGQKNQPVKGSWVVPTSQQFMTIFPSTPHAGNIALRKGGNNTTPMTGWGWTNDGSGMDASVTTLRVTVPYYTPGMAEPTSRSENYRAAWRTLQSHNDVGTTQLDKYSTGYGPNGSDKIDNVGCEPDGDPEDGYATTYIISRDGDDKMSLDGSKCDIDKYVIKEWGTIYAIKRAYTSEAYRMRWRVLVAGYFGKNNAPGLYVEICRYRCDADDMLTEKNFKTKYDWDHPVARIYFPITGLGDYKAVYINFGTECQYATSDPITYPNEKDNYGVVSALQIKITGDEQSNVYMAVVKNRFSAAFGMQIRPVGGGKTTVNE